jgi:hypothetical protein
MPLHVWDGNLLCAKRMEKTYFEYVKNKEYCKSWMRPCGVVDSLNNILCVDSTQKCPINKIVFLRQDSMPNYYNYTKLSSGTNKTVYFTTEAVENNIYVDIKVSEGEMCIDPYQKNIINGEPYLLQRDYDDYH